MPHYVPDAGNELVIDKRSQPSWKAYSHSFNLNIPSLIECHPIKGQKTNFACLFEFVMCARNMPYSVGLCLLYCIQRIYFF